MPQTQMRCPRCQQPVVVQVEQLIDVSSDPEAKQRLLGGISNTIRCTSCGYAGNVATPIVYHDNDKELLLSYFPAEMAIPLNEQEKVFGPLINQVVNKLPPEKRKAYLFRPQSFLTFQSLIERILGADGITPEMIKSQQAKTYLLERILSASSDELRKDLIKQEASLIDNEFFALFSHLLESVVASGNEEAAKQLSSIQQLLLEGTEVGKKIQSQANEVQEAVKSLQAVGDKLTREKLLEILEQAPTEMRLSALVSLTRAGLDYEFFQLLTQKLEKKSGQEKEKLSGLRDKLLELTREIDQKLQAEQKKASELLDLLLAAPDLENTITEHVNEINEIFIQLINTAISQATRDKDQAKMTRLQEIVAILQEMSTPPEYQFLQLLLDAPDPSALEKLLVEHDAEINDEFTQFLATLAAQSGGQEGKQPDPQQAALLEKVQGVYQVVLRYVMKRNMK